MTTPDQMQLEDVAKLRSCAYFVEATRCEQYYLWKENQEHWRQDASGFGLGIGDIQNTNKGVFVSFSFNYIAGQLVCFYEATSRYVDHELVEQFCKQFWKGHCDANNFHNALNHCVETFNKSMPFDKQIKL